MAANTPKVLRWHLIWPVCSNEIYEYSSCFGLGPTVLSHLVSPCNSRTLVPQPRQGSESRITRVPCSLYPSAVGICEGNKTG